MKSIVGIFVCTIFSVISFVPCAAAALLAPPPPSINNIITPVGVAPPSNDTSESIMPIGLDNKAHAENISSSVRIVEPLSLMPAVTLALIDIPNLPIADNLFWQSDVGRTLNNRLISRPVESLTARFESSMRSLFQLPVASSGPNLLTNTLSNIFPSRVVLGLSKGGRGTLSLIACIQIDGEITTSQDFMDRALEQYVRTNKPASPSKYSFNDISVSTATTPSGESLQYTYLGNQLIITTDRDIMELMISNYVSPGRMNISKSGRLSVIRSRIEDANILKIAVNTQALNSALLEDEQWMRGPFSVATANILSGYDEVAIGINIVGSDIRESISVHLSEKGLKEKLGSSTTSIKISGTLAKYMPSNTLFFYTLSWNPLNDYEKWVSQGTAKNRWDSSLSSLLNNKKTLAQRLLSWTKKSKISIERSLLPALNNEIAFGIIEPDNLGASPEHIMIIKVKDPTAVETFLGKLPGVIRRTKNGINFTKTKYSGTAVYKGVSTKKEETAPSIAITEDALLIASSVITLRKILVQMQDGQETLVSQSSFANAASFFDNDASSIGYIDIKGIVNSLYAQLMNPQTAKTLGLDIALLPPVETVCAYIRPMAWFTSSDNSGEIKTSIRGTLGPVILSTGAFIAIAPTLMEYHDAQRRENAKNRLKEINLGIQLYAADFDKFPRRLSDLYPTYIKELSTFESPSHEGQIKEKLHIDTRSGLTYITGHSLQDLSNEILLFEDSRGYGGIGRHIITINGRVKWMSEALFQMQINKENSEK